jgi:inosine/guanosine/xanthosine phosphorylase family protein
MSVAFARFAEAARARKPQVAFVLGSGMGGIAARVGYNSLSVTFDEIPGLPSASVAGHRGRLILGDWSGRTVLVFQGRLHRYEGHAWDDVIRPVHIARSLGVEILLFTNAAGGIRDDLTPGCLMALTNHIEWTRPACWPYPGSDGLAPADPPVYDTLLRQRLHGAAQTVSVSLGEGVYAAVTGPSYETPAEIRALRACGADAVGMSTAREAVASLEAGIACAAISLITNRAAGLTTGKIHHGDVLTTAAQASERLARLLDQWLVSI